MAHRTTDSPRLRYFVTVAGLTGSTRAWHGAKAQPRVGGQVGTQRNPSVSDQPKQGNGLRQ